MAKVWLKTKLQNLAMKKKEAYVTRSVTLPRIDKEQLLERAADNSGISRGIVYVAADAICREFENQLLNGHSVEIPLVGSFRFGVNAKATDTEKEAGAAQVYRRKILYLPSKALWRKLQQVRLIGVNEDDGSNAGSGING
ncbi:MAG: hypothetical protein IKG96_07035 [Bacteroidaceae bacterium]|nr:hypothetical protein [Bacteroidaceae bacterium]